MTATTATHPRQLLDAGAPLTEGVGRWADQSFQGDGPRLQAARLLLEAGLPLTVERLHRLLWCEDPVVFEALARYGSRKVWRQAVRGSWGEAPRAAELRQMLEERPRQEARR